MKKNILFIIVMMVFTFCERNHKPSINNLTCSPGSGSAGTVFNLKVFATDEDGDLLMYDWKADVGTFSNMTTAREVNWISPVTSGGKEVVITVVVSDGEKEVSRSCKVLLGEPDLGCVAGQVNFTNFKIPIQGVTISIGGKTAITDLNGDFFVSEIPAISDTLFVRKQDYSSLNNAVKIPANDTLNVILEITSVNFTSKVSGTVKDQDGVFLENVKLIALNPDGTQSKLRATSDEAGSYRLWYIPFGERIIVASKEATDDCSYSELSTAIDLDDLQTQLNLVLQKSSFSGTFTDSRDQHDYNYKKIGSQTWMTENLAYLPEVSPPVILSVKEPHYYVYEYEGTDLAEAMSTAKFKQYGVLYNWTALKTACPAGWHVPSMLEWDNLFYYLEPDAIRKMKSTSDWNGRGGGSNSSGLNVFPAGQVNIEGAFSGSGDAAFLWTSTVLAYLQPGFRGLSFDSNELSLNKGSEKMGCSVRCIRNN